MRNYGMSVREGGREAIESERVRKEGGTEEEREIEEGRKTKEGGRGHSLCLTFIRLSLLHFRQY